MNTDREGYGMKLKKWSDLSIIERVLIVVVILVMVAFVVVAMKTFTMPPTTE